MTLMKTNQTQKLQITVLTVGHIVSSPAARSPAVAGQTFHKFLDTFWDNYNT